MEFTTFTSFQVDHRDEDVVAIYLSNGVQVGYVTKVEPINDGFYITATIVDEVVHSAMRIHAELNFPVFHMFFARTDTVDLSVVA